MPYTSLDNAAPPIKRIEPPVSLAQANQIAEWADAIDPATVEDPWAVAIAQFRRLYEPIQGGWKLKPTKESLDNNIPPPIMESNMKDIQLFGELIESVANSDGLSWRVALIQEGESQNRTYYSASVLQQALPLFEGAPCFADHGSGEKSVRDIVGWFSSPTYEANSVTANFNILASESWFRDKVTEAWERGKRDLIGFSILGYGKRRPAKAADGHSIQEVTSLNQIISIDAVARPAAGGRFLHPIKEETDEMDTEPVEGISQEALVASAISPLNDEIASLREAVNALAKEREAFRKERELEAALATSNLPTTFQANLRKRFLGKEFTTAELKEAIDDERAALDSLKPASLPDLYSARITESSADKIEKAMDGMFEGQNIDGVPAFQTLRHAFSVITGTPIFDVRADDVLRESARHFDSGAIREDITSASWAQILGKSITRQMLKEYRTDRMMDWRKVARVENLTDMKEQDRLQKGGYGELTTVTEGQDFPNLTAPGEQRQSYTPVVRGGIEQITFTAIANDDMRQIRLVPRKLARAAKATLYHRVFSVFTTNAAMQYDSVALFHATHANMGTGALTDETLTAAYTAMKQQVVPVGASATVVEHLDNTPKYLIVPTAMWRTAWDLVNNVVVVTAGQNASLRNPFSGRLEVIEVQRWTDPNNWYLVADPNETPTIEVGFYGSQEPELFTEMANTGANFTADLIRYKVRHIYGVTAVEHRGMYGAIVA